MIKIKIIAFVGIIVGSGMVACQEDAGPSKAELISKTWKAISGTANGAPYVSTFQPCGLDDLYEFTKDKVYTEDEGALKCSPTDPQIIKTGTWSIEEYSDPNKFSQLTIFYPFDTAYFFINKLTPTTLTLTSKEPNWATVITYSPQ